MPAPSGFSYEMEGSAGSSSTTTAAARTLLRGATANRFLAAVESGDPQQLMARATGNYKRGNERMGKEIAATVDGDLGFRRCWDRVST